MKIFVYSEPPDPSLHSQAWAAAFVLIMFVLVISLTARYFLSRSQRKLTAPARRCLTSSPARSSVHNLSPPAFSPRAGGPATLAAKPDHQSKGKEKATT